MSSDSLKNPFTQGPEQPPTDTDVVEALLGKGVANDFAALTPHQEETPPEADLSSGELALTREEEARADAREQEQTLEQQARTWFLNLGKDKRWIDEHFTFEDGQIKCKKELINLRKQEIVYLPKFFSYIKDVEHLNLSQNNLISLENVPTNIEGNLILSGNPLTSVKGLSEVAIEGNLELSNFSELTSLTDLPQKIGKSLDLSENRSLTSLDGIPSRDGIGGKIYFSENQKELIEHLQMLGYTVGIYYL